MAKAWGWEESVSSSVESCSLEPGPREHDGKPFLELALGSVIWQRPHNQDWSSGMPEGGVDVEPFSASLYLELSVELSLSL